MSEVDRVGFKTMHDTARSYATRQKLTINPDVCTGVDYNRSSGHVLSQKLSFDAVNPTLKDAVEQPVERKRCLIETIPEPTPKVPEITHLRSSLIVKNEANCLGKMSLNQRSI